MKKKFLGLICLMLIIIPCSIMLAACKKEEAPKLEGKYSATTVTYVSEGVETTKTKAEYNALVAKENKTTEDEIAIEMFGYVFGMEVELKEDKTFVMSIEGEDDIIGTWKLDGDTLTISPAEGEEGEPYTAKVEDGKVVISMLDDGEGFVMTFEKK